VRRASRDASAREGAREENERDEETSARDDAREGSTGVRSRMQRKGITQRVEESACRNESKLALACATSQPADDKSACDELFQAYKDCRKLEHERVVRERIERRKSAF
jgi:hypothetical protein